MLRALAADAVLLRCRHLVWVLAAAALCITGFLIAQPIQELQPPSPEQVAQARADYRAELAWWEAHQADLEAACVADGGTAAECAVPSPELEQYLPWQADYSWASHVVILIAAALLGLTTFGIGAVFVGAEFTNGTATTWHTHLPRRWVMVVSKLITVGYLAAVGAVVTFAASLVAVHIAAGVWGVPASAQQVGSSVVSALHGTAFVILSGVLGAATSFITRRAAVTVALAAGYLVLNRLVVSYELWTGVLPALDFITQARAWIEGGFELNFWNSAGPQEVFLDPRVGALVWVAMTGVMVVAALVMHRRRDLA